MLFLSLAYATSEAGLRGSTSNQHHGSLSQGQRSPSKYIYVPEAKNKIHSLPWGWCPLETLPPWEVRGRDFPQAWRQ